MRKLIPFALLVAVGCQGPASSTSNSNESPKQLTPTGETLKPNDKESVLGDGSPEVAGGRPVTHPEQGFNDKRLYQLKDLATTTIEVHGKKIKCWVMDEDSKRSEGMMFLTQKEAPIDHGMLFVFAEDQPRSFWMRNTLIDLDLAYINAKGKTVSIHRLKHLDETGVPGKAPAKYVLEMPANGFKPFGIKEGSQFKIPAELKSKDGG